MANRAYSESQSYAGTWVMYFISCPEAPTLVLLIVLYFTGEDKQAMGIALGLVAGTMAIVLILLFKIKLETRIDSYGISFRYSPFVRNRKKLTKSQIKSREVRQYQPLLDYGGWGIKGNKTTWAYSILEPEGFLLDAGEKNNDRNYEAKRAQELP